MYILTMDWKNPWKPEESSSSLLVAWGTPQLRPMIFNQCACKPGLADVNVDVDFKLSMVPDDLTFQQSVSLYIREARAVARSNVPKLSTSSIVYREVKN